MNNEKKKRTSSFRKIFPFFGSKSKEKYIHKNAHEKDSLEQSKSNQYENPRSVNNKNDRDTERIYENLKNDHEKQLDIDSYTNTSASCVSSNSTLVSAQINTLKLQDNNNIDANNDNDNFDRGLKHRVIANSNQNTNVSSSYSSSDIVSDKIINSDQVKYPNVYYHSLEKSNRTSPLDNIEVYKNVNTSSSRTNPVPVAAEIKSFSTKFLISPKKEADVRTIQQLRAKSLSVENNESSNVNLIKNVKSKKSYVYSAPTSPLPNNMKIPNMPKTVSPYEHVRKTLNESEEKKTISRKVESNSPKMTTLNKPYLVTAQINDLQFKHEIQKDINGLKEKDTMQKGVARHNIEAYYWRTLKEIKGKEDDYYRNHSLSYTNHYKPYTQVRSLSLPRGKDLQKYSAQQALYNNNFRQNVEKRINERKLSVNSEANSEIIIYRHPEKNVNYTRQGNSVDQSQLVRIFHRESEEPNIYMNYSPTNRVSSESDASRLNIPIRATEDNLTLNRRLLMRNNIKDQDVNMSYENKNYTTRSAPQPPQRTSSIRQKTMKQPIVNDHYREDTLQSYYTNSEAHISEDVTMMNHNNKTGKIFNYFISKLTTRLSFAHVFFVLEFIIYPPRGDL